jgi:hypothetical protein
MILTEHKQPPILNNYATLFTTVPTAPLFGAVYFWLQYVKNNANRATFWRGFREIWRSPKPKLASKVLAHGAKNR